MALAPPAASEGVALVTVPAGAHGLVALRAAVSVGAARLAGARVAWRALLLLFSLAPAPLLHVARIARAPRPVVFHNALIVTPTASCFAHVHALVFVTSLSGRAPGVARALELEAARDGMPIGSEAGFAQALGYVGIALVNPADGVGTAGHGVAGVVGALWSACVR